jgi:hypothetical protein
MIFLFDQMPTMQATREQTAFFKYLKDKLLPHIAR